MIKISVLSPGFTNPNSTAFLFPLIKFRRTLKKYGFQISITDRYTDDLMDGDVLLLESKYFKNDWSPESYDSTLRKIEKISQNIKLIWCDQGDSTGTFLGQVLPFVHTYAKSQILKDKTEYQKTPYASRIYTDYYHKKYGIIDQDPYIEEPVKDHKDLNKITLSWNSGLMNYGWISPYLMKIRNHIPLNAMLQFSDPIASAEKKRKQAITCRMGISYPRETVCYQRRRIRDILSKHLPTDKLSRHQYFKELTNSKICISPFGYGEITLKDFECFLSGSLLFKPDMSHMDTWPNFFEKNVTYASHSWNLDDIESLIEKWLDNGTERVEVAGNAQQCYVEYTTGKNASSLFADHFQSIITA